MRRILLIIGNYYPNPSSVANCMKPLINRMNEEYHVDIITNRKDINIDNYERKNDINIYRIDDYRIINTNLIRKMKNINSSITLKFFSHFLLSIIKILYYIRYVVFAKEKGTGGWRLNEVVEKCLDLHKQNKYNIVISVSQPFKSHLIAEKFVESVDDNINWFIYEFDPYYFNDELSKNTLRKKIMYRDEYRVFKKCNKIFLTPELYNFYKKTKYNEVCHKFISMPFANIEFPQYNLDKISNYNIIDDNKINFLYAGRLYDNIREPKGVLDFFSKVNENIDFNLVFMTNWPKKKFFKYNYDNFNIKIVPFQNRDTALYTIYNSDFLINIGNTVKFQIPAKIFEYMSTGKPIIHFAKIKDDPVNKYMRKYPKAFVFYEKGKINKKTLKKFEQFYYENKNNELEYSYLKNELEFLNKEKIINIFMKHIKSI